MGIEVIAYLVVLATWGVVLVTRSSDPSLLFRVTREDGPVEWATVAALLVLMLMLVRRLPPLVMPRWLKGCGYLLAGLCLLAAMEEISWGQRILGFETVESVKQLNLQQEMNLHNLVKAELFNGMIVFTLGIGFVLIPMIVRQSWPEAPVWIPGRERSMLMLMAILVNHYQFRSTPEQVGIVILVGLLCWGSALALSQPALRIAALLAWGNLLVLYPSRSVLQVANHQYEIRELLIILAVAAWSLDILRHYEREIGGTRGVTATLGP